MIQQKTDSKGTTDLEINLDEFGRFDSDCRLLALAVLDDPSRRQPLADKAKALQSQLAAFEASQLAERDDVQEVISECRLDLWFVLNPDQKGLSLRLGRDYRRRQESQGSTG